MKQRHAVGVLIASVWLAGLCGCSADKRALPPVFGAVFGIDGAPATPYALGKVPDPVPRAGDRVIGSAANAPGLCIWRDAADRRYRAACPADFAQ